MRRLMIGLCLCVGCRGWERPRPEFLAEPPPVPVARADADDAPGVVAVRHDEELPDADPFVPDALAMAARCIDTGDEVGAAAHLASHLEANPDEVMIRAYLAELLMRGGDLGGAKDAFGRFVAEAQFRDGPPRDHLIHCHTRLMEIAIREGDTDAEHLHRGIGLFLLSHKGPNADPLVREEVLCKAMAELSRVRSPRADWYLYRVYDSLGEFGSARRALRSAGDAEAFAALTPAEREGLHLALALAR